jgi:glycerophosphoryl diester phosphodiesterase
MFKRLIAIGMALSLMFIVAACSSGNNGVVAIVNGIEISREAFDTELNYNLQEYQQQEVELSEEDLETLKQLVLDKLVNTALLVDAAKKAGFTPGTVDIDGEMASIIAQFQDQDQFEQALAAEGLSLDDYKELIGEYLMVQGLFEAELDIDSVMVNDDEVQEMLDMFLAQYGDEDADFDVEDARAYFASTLREEKIDALIGDFIQELRQNSEIEYFKI